MSDQEKDTITVHGKEFRLNNPESETLKHLVKSWGEYSEDHLHRALKGVEDHHGKTHIGNNIFAERHPDGTYTLSHHN